MVKFNTSQSLNGYVAVKKMNNKVTVDLSGEGTFAPSVGNGVTKLNKIGNAYYVIVHTGFQPTGSGTWNSSHVNHFFWSKDSRVSYAVNYNDANTTYEITPATTDVFFTNNQTSGHENEPNSSFTVNNETGIWRVLTEQEWKHLLNVGGNEGRTDANRFAKAKVNNTNGLLIFPDGYTGTTSCTGIADVNSSSIVATSCYNYRYYGYCVRLVR